MVGHGPRGVCLEVLVARHVLGVLGREATDARGVGTREHLLARRDRVAKRQQVGACRQYVREHARVGATHDVLGQVAYPQVPLASDAAIVGMLSADTMRRKVLLPAPFGPTSPMRSPALTRRLSARKSRCAP